VSAIIVMGPSGCGKSTLGKVLAADLGWVFVEGDDLHPQANIHKMSAGIPLTDDDRQPFLHNVGKAIAQYQDTGVVAACSALKKSYRDLLRAYSPDAVFVLPPSDRDTLLANMAVREDHFMPTSLVDSQLETLEIPGGEEHCLLLTSEVTAQAVVAEVKAILDLG